MTPAAALDDGLAAFPDAPTDAGAAADGLLDAAAGGRRADHLRIRAIRPLVSPVLLREHLPTGDEALAVVARARANISAALHGDDDRLVVVVGPCSIHDHEQALAYARLLQQQARMLENNLIVVMRVYFEKPRTTVGWTGSINDPRLDGSFRINEGLRRARELLVEINRMGLPTGAEFLDLLTPQYVADLIAWGAIGARTTESQTHRQLASGLPCPIAFKNGTDGSVQVAVDALLSSRAPHALLGITERGHAAIFETRGNDDCHIILRGGRTGPNYDAASVDAACALLRRAGLRGQVMVDCSHANAEKQHRRQIDVAFNLAERIAQGDRRILGVMIESHLEEGRQDLNVGVPLKHGVSITDACISWRQTAPILRALAEAAAARQAPTHARADVATSAP